MFHLTPHEQKILGKLNSPKKIQDFLDTIPFNFETNGDTCLSPRRVLREQRAHCIEGAFVAALALRLQKQRPLILDLTSAIHDTDHIIVPFRQYGCWGAISKTNHSVLRYREPIYRTIRELAASYFHEYFDAKGYKTLRSYTQPIHLSRFDKLNWMTSEDHLWDIVRYIIDVPHTSFLKPSQYKHLRKADGIEQYGSSFPEWISQDKRNPLFPSA